MPRWDLGIVVALVFVTLGAVFAQLEPSQEPVDLDVWARLEEIAQGEEMQAARRARQQQINREAHRSSRSKQ